VGRRCIGLGEDRTHDRRDERAGRLRHLRQHVARGVGSASLRARGAGSVEAIAWTRAECASENHQPDPGESPATGPEGTRSSRHRSRLQDFVHR
jgi:hypothetical protein